MKLVLVFRNAQCEGAGYFGTFLNERNIPWCEIRIDKGEAVPEIISGYSGLVFMGGPMSVNDELPWIPPVLNTIRNAVENDIPVLGHCLGGQLISKALGAEVTKTPIREIGWGTVQVSQNETARQWFGDVGAFNSFHWHGETFALPQGATHVLASAYCENQAWAMGKHFAMQCHVEMLPEMVQTWCEVGKDELQEAAASPAVQQVDEMHRLLDADCASLNKVADQIYSKWIQGLVEA